MAATLFIVAVGCQPAADTTEKKVEGEPIEKMNPEANADTMGNVTFERVAAVFNANCMPCHSSQNRKGGYDLSTYDTALKELVPGDPANSEILQYLKGEKQPQMPFKRAPLSAEDIATIETWIKTGAKA